MTQQGAGSDCSTGSLSAAKRTDRLWGTPAFRSMAQRTIVTADTHNTSGFCSRTLQHLIALPVFSAAICVKCGSRVCAALRCVRTSFVLLSNEVHKGSGSICTYPTPTERHVTLTASHDRRASLVDTC